MPFRRRTLNLLTLLAAVALLAVPLRGADAASSDVRPFRPAPATTDRYEVDPPPPLCQATATLGCDGQKAFVTGRSGRIYVETALPRRRVGGPPLPERLPTILLMTPYVPFDALAGRQMQFRKLSDYFVPKGYAVAIGHVPGTGNSDGCYSMGGPDEVDATARVIDFLGRRAPWSNGAVGMIGLSANGTTAVGAASLGDRTLVEPLKAIVPVAAVVGGYDFVALNGVSTGLGAATPATYAAISALPGGHVGTDRRMEPCAAENLDAGARIDTDGSYGTHWRAREYRRGAGEVTAATLMFQGLDDYTVTPVHPVGWFDRLPKTTPHKLVLGQWGHGWPDGSTDGTEPQPGGRQDWLAMTHAWFDRFLLGAETGVEKWPAVQVQGEDRRWRSAPAWPAVGKTFGHLPLDRTATVNEVGPPVDFEVPLPEGLRLSGQPVLDLWLEVGNTVGVADAHIGVTVEALGPAETTAGAPDAERRVIGRLYGARSVQHRDPMINGYFDQVSPVAPTLGEVFRLPVPMAPADVLVPPGGLLRVRVGGSTAPSSPDPTVVPTMPSGAASTVVVHHGCDSLSALRFVIPADEGELDVLTVGELDVLTVEGGTAVAPESEPITRNEVRRPLCGRPPLDPQLVLAGRA